MTDEKTMEGVEVAPEPKKKREAKKLYLFEIEADKGRFRLDTMDSREFQTERDAYKFVEAMGKSAEGKTFVIGRIGRHFIAHVDTITKTTINRA